PGGGFIAGLVSALSLILLVFVSGLGRVRSALRINPVTLAAIGVGLAVGTTLLPLVFGLPLLSHLYVDILGISPWPAVVFALGVYLTVVGVTLTLTDPLMTSVRGRSAFAPDGLGHFYAEASESIDELESVPGMEVPPDAEPSPETRRI